MELKWIAIAMAFIFGVFGLGVTVDKYGAHQVEIAKIQQEKCK